jgi:hypothetical protein
MAPSDLAAMVINFVGAWRFDGSVSMRLAPSYDEICNRTQSFIKHCKYHSHQSALICGNAICGIQHAHAMSSTGCNKILWHASVRLFVDGIMTEHVIVRGAGNVTLMTQLLMQLAVSLIMSF